MLQFIYVTCYQLTYACKKTAKVTLVPLAIVTFPHAMNNRESTLARVQTLSSGYSPFENIGFYTLF